MIHTVIALLEHIHVMHVFSIAIIVFFNLVPVNGGVEVEVIHCMLVLMQGKAYGLRRGV